MERNRQKIIENNQIYANIDHLYVFADIHIRNLSNIIYIPNDIQIFADIHRETIHQLHSNDKDIPKRLSIVQNM